MFGPCSHKSNYWMKTTTARNLRRLMVTCPGTNDWIEAARAAIYAQQAHVMKSGYTAQRVQ